MICCVSRAKIDFQGRKIDRRMHLIKNFRIFQNSSIFDDLAGFQPQNSIPGAISCPGQVSNRSGLEFQANSIFSVHMAFVRRPSVQALLIKKSESRHGTKTEQYFMIPSYTQK